MDEGNEAARGARRQAIRRRVQRKYRRFYARCSDWSFARTPSGNPIHWHREHWIIGSLVLAMVLLSVIAMPSWGKAMHPTAASIPHVALPLHLPPAPKIKPKAPALTWRTVTVQSGQTLSNIFQSLGLSSADLHAAVKATEQSHALTSISPGDTFSFAFNPHGQFEAMRFEPDIAHRVTLHFKDGNVSKSVKTYELENRRFIAHGVIRSSLSAAGHHAGLHTQTIVDLTNVFHSNINFARQARAGDAFTVVYELVYRNGAYMQTGPVLAATFTNRGKTYTAFRFTLPNGQSGYYDKQGRPLRTSLLRTPVKYSRISSPFGWRVDPILHSRHLHAGVDLAAPMGTPIHAAGNGVITIHRWVHGYGRYIRIRDSAAVSTAYAHMSRYAPGLHDGSHVHQGEIIGYVGESGWATGPHLHYEVRIHGKPVNPLTVTLPPPSPLKPTLLAKFEHHARPLLASMQHYDAYLHVASIKSVGTDKHAG